MYNPLTTSQFGTERQVLKILVSPIRFLVTPQNRNFLIIDLQ